MALLIKKRGRFFSPSAEKKGKGKRMIEEEKKEDILLIILRTLSAWFLPLSFSLDELAKADLILAGTIKEEKKNEKV